MTDKLPLSTTLNRIREHSPCTDSWRKLLGALGKTLADDEALTYLKILDICGLDDALWALRAEPQHSRLYRHMACDFADTVRHLMTDKRSTDAIDVARRHADGLASDSDLAAARDAAWAAASAAAAARDAAWAAASAAAWAAARDAAWAAASAAAIAANRQIFIKAVS